MTREIRRKLAVGAIAALGMGGVGTGVAMSQSSTPAKSVVTVRPAAAVQQTQLDPTVQQTPMQAEAPEPSGPDSDNLQVGDQNAPDSPGAEANEKAEGPENEKAEGPEKEADENLPGGGHQDPPGQNVDHQFEGVE